MLDHQFELVISNEEVFIRILLIASHGTSCVTREFFDFFSFYFSDHVKDRGFSTTSFSEKNEYKFIHMIFLRH